MQRHYALIASIIYLIMMPVHSFAQQFNLPGFGGDHFCQFDRNQPGSFHKVQDPLTNAGKNKVFEFSIVPHACIKADCQQQSARSTVQQYNARQPKEAWYGWDIYFPIDFAYGPKQIGGFNTYNEWKDQDECMLVGLTNFGGPVDPQSGKPDLQLSWRMQNSQLPGDCPMVLKREIVDFKELLGKWNRFEVFVRWSKDEDGKVMIFLDGKLKVNYEGVTCFAACNSKMYYLFGQYICCTADTTAIVANKVYYKNVSRSKKREGLKWLD